jgi:pyruvate,water dikinase
MELEASKVRWFATLRNTDVPLVGGKNASLSEMCGRLGAAGVCVPNGFAMTDVDGWPRLKALLDGPC